MSFNCSGMKLKFYGKNNPTFNNFNVDNVTIKRGSKGERERNAT